jgi:hypothetical protein
LGKRDFLNSDEEGVEEDEESAEAEEEAESVD